MPPQMIRMDHVHIADSLLEALDGSYDVLQELAEVYRIAKRNFRKQENDVDPATVALGIQAQALGLKTIAVWLEAISTVAGKKYRDRAELCFIRAQQELELLGLVIPDVMTL